MNISYRKNRNTKKALAFALISLFISALSTAFIFLGAESVILAPPSAFFFALFLDSLYPSIHTHPNNNFNYHFGLHTSK